MRNRYWITGLLLVIANIVLSSSADWSIFGVGVERSLAQLAANAFERGINEGDLIKAEVAISLFAQRATLMKSDKKGRWYRAHFSENVKSGFELARILIGGEQLSKYATRCADWSELLVTKEDLEISYWIVGVGRDTPVEIQREVLGRLLHQYHPGRNPHYKTEVLPSEFLASASFYPSVYNILRCARRTIMHLENPEHLEMSLSNLPRYEELESWYEKLKYHENAERREKALRLDKMENVLWDIRNRTSKVKLRGHSKKNHNLCSEWLMD